MSLFTKEEIATLSFALRTTINDRKELVARSLELDEQEAGLSLVKKLKPLTQDDKFIDGDLELTTEEKALVLKLCKRPWGAGDLEAKATLCEKLA